MIYIILCTCYGLLGTCMVMVKPVTIDIVITLVVPDVV